MFKDSQMESRGILANQYQTRLECEVGINAQCYQQGNKQTQKQLNNMQHSQEQQQKRTLDALSLLLQVLQNPQKYQQHPNENTPQNKTNSKIIIQQPNQHDNDTQNVVKVQNKEQQKDSYVQNEMSMLGNVKSTSKNQITQQPVQLQLESPMQTVQQAQHNPSSARKQPSFSILPNPKPRKPYLPQLSNKPQSGISMYEQVLAKNFQVINGLLKKLNQIYSHNENYDKTIADMNQKMHKLQVDNENIHHQFRTSHFAIDKKLNSITNQYSNMLQDLNFLQKIWNESQGINKTQFFQRVFANHYREEGEKGEGGKRNPLKRRGTRREKRKSQLSKALINESSNYKHNQQSKTYPPQFIYQPLSNLNPSHHKLPPSQPVRRSSAHHKKSIHLIRRGKNLSNLKGLNERNLGRELLQEISESNIRSQFSKQNQDEYFTAGQQQSNSSVSIANNSEMEQVTLTNNVQPIQQVSIKPKRRPKTYNTQSLALEDSRQQQLGKYISKQIPKHGDQLSEFTQLGILTMMQRKCKELEGRVQLKIGELKRQLVEDKIERQLKPQLISDMQAALNKDVQTLRAQLTNNMQQLQNTLRQQLTTKCSHQQARQDLKQILQSMNTKVSTLMDDCYHKFAERNQTKRAILFLEQKINRLVEVGQRFNVDVKLDDQQERVKCLSCNKGFVGILGDNISSALSSKMQYQTHQQPMLGQVHLLQKSTQLKQFHHYNNQQQQQQQQLPQTQTLNMSKLRNLSKFNSVSEIFQNSEKEQHYGIKQSTSPKGNYKKKSQTTLSVNANSNSKLKYPNRISENRPKTSCSIGIINNTEFSQKSWKEKATNLLKKDHSGVNWRSKSQYKK